MDNNGSFVEQLMGIKGGARGLLYDSERDRFNMPHSADTSVRKELNANRITIGGNDIAIATQYPFLHQMEAQLQMLVDNFTPVLIVLASRSDMQNHQLPEYFSSSDTFGEIQTHSKFVDYIDLDNTIEAKIFRLSISGYKDSIDIPVIHVHNWPDHRTVSPETTTKLVDLIETTAAERRAFYEETKHPAIDDAGKMLPVMHCKAGVGRTGQTIAAMAMKKYAELTLASITTDLRISRNDLMIQTPRQMETLIKLEGMRNKTPPPASRSWRSLFGKK